MNFWTASFSSLLVTFINEKSFESRHKQDCAESLVLFCYRLEIIFIALLNMPRYKEIFMDFVWGRGTKKIPIDKFNLWTSINKNW